MRRSSLLLALTVLLSSWLPAQSTEKDLRTRLISKPLYLRGMWRDDKLSFDSTGKLISASRSLSWTLCGVQIKSVKIEAGQLILSGERVGVEIESNVPKRVVLHREDRETETIRIAIQLPADGDYTQPLSAVFVEGIPDLLPLMPPYWQSFVKNCVLAPSGSPSTQNSACPQTVKDTIHPRPSDSAGLTSPVVISTANAVLSSSAPALGYGGHILISLQIDESGKADHFNLLRGVGLGLDEQALVAASQFTFRPGMRDGRPVRADLTIEIEFK